MRKALFIEITLYGFKRLKSGVCLNSNLDRRDIYELVLTQLKEFERPDTEDNGVKPFMLEHWEFHLHPFLFLKSTYFLSNITFSFIKTIYLGDCRICNLLLSPDNTAELALMKVKQY